MRFILSLALCLAACAGRHNAAATGLPPTISLDLTSADRLDATDVPTRSYGLQVCDSNHGPAGSLSWALKIRLLCAAEFPRQVNMPHIVLLRRPPPFVPRIFCGGTYPPDDVLSSRELEVQCKGRTGWVTP